MEDRQTIWDPLRKKDVSFTPEERVRQWFIGILASKMDVPMHMMMSEAGFRLGAKQFRADIVVYDRKMQPLIVVECKRPEVELCADVLDQAIRYNLVLNVKYIIITNGVKTYVCCRKESECNPIYEFVNELPLYDSIK